MDSRFDTKGLPPVTPPQRPGWKIGVDFRPRPLERRVRCRPFEAGPGITATATYFPSSSGRADQAAVDLLGTPLILGKPCVIRCGRHGQALGGAGDAPRVRTGTARCNRSPGSEPPPPNAQAQRTRPRTGTLRTTSNAHVTGVRCGARLGDTIGCTVQSTTGIRDVPFGAELQKAYMPPPSAAAPGSACFLAGRGRYFAARSFLTTASPTPCALAGFWPVMSKPSSTT